MGKRDDLPMRQVLALTTCNLAQSVMITLPFTVGVYMTRMFVGPGGSEQQIGRMAGLLAAAYSFAQFTTSYAWGLFSNKYGRKPVLVIGTGVCAVALVAFGLAGSYWVAMGARIAAGLANGIIGAWKCMIGESYSAGAQAHMMAYMSLSWGVGAILGPAVGGALSQPCAASSTAAGGAGSAGGVCGPGGLLAERPYLLPCLVAAALNAASCLVCVVALEETLPELVDTRHHKQQQGQQTLTRTTTASKGAAVSTAAATSGPGPLVARLRGWWQQRRGYTALEQQEGGPRAALGCCDSSRSSSSSSGGGGEPQLIKAHRGDSSSSLCHQTRLSSQKQAAGGLELAQLGRVSEPDTYDSDTTTSSRTAAGSNRPGAASCHQQQQQAGAVQQQGPTPSPGSRAPARLRVNSDHVLQQYRTSDDTGGGLVQHIAQEGPGPREGSPMCDTPSSSAGTVIEHPSASESDPDSGRSSPLTGLLPVSTLAAGVGVSPGGGLVAGGQHPPPRWVLGEEEEEQGAVHGQQPSSTCCQSVLAGRLDSAMQYSSSSRWGQGSSPWRQDCEYNPLQPNSSGSKAGVCEEEECGGGPLPPGQDSSGSGPWWRNRQVVLAVLGYGAVCLLFICLDEVTPIYASAPLTEGGLALKEAALAGPLVANGAVLIAFSLWAYPWLQQRLGTLPLVRIGLWLTLAVCAALPAPSLLLAAGGPGWAASLLLYGALSLKAVAGCSAFTGAMILVNLVTPPHQLGAVNGAGQSLASFVRGLGPAAGGLLWAAAVSLGRSGAQALPFGAISLCVVGAWGVYRGLAPPAPAELPR